MIYYKNYNISLNHNNYKPMTLTNKFYYGDDDDVVITPEDVDKLPEGIWEAITGEE